MSELISRYQFFTPCIGCHFYLHASRIPLSLLLGRIPVVAGERETHDGAIKVNQTSGCPGWVRGLVLGIPCSAYPSVKADRRWKRGGKNLRITLGKAKDSWGVFFRGTTGNRVVKWRLPNPSSADMWRNLRFP